MAASPKRRIAIALQMVRNSIGGTRSASDRSDTVRCFVPSVKLCRTVEGAGSFGAVIELDVLKEHTAVIYMVLAADPQPLVGSEQIQCRKQCVICFEDVLGGKLKSCPMLFIKVGHRRFLAFYIFIESLTERRTAYLPHGGCQYLRGCCSGYCDKHL